MGLYKRMAKPVLLVSLRVSMIFIFIGWISLWILRPTNLWTRSWHQVEDRMKNTYFGYYGFNCAVLLFPFIALALIGLLYFSFLQSPSQNRCREEATRGMTVSNPVIINRFIGTVSCPEIITLLLFLLLLAWTFYAHVSNDFKNLMPIRSMTLDLWQWKFLRIATRFGLLAEACIALLLLPVLRGLSMFRLLSIQFEAAVKYHIWIGTAMIFFSLVHGGSIIFIWIVSHQIEDEIWKWNRTGRINLAGFIALVAALLMSITSLPQIRRKKFEVFYYTHHLYVIFLVFVLFHVGDRHFYWVFPGIFLFGLDKVLRIIQSRSESCVLSATLFPCKAIQLVLPKDPGLTYAPSGIVFVNIPSISRFQWHPFSITSCSIVDRHTMSVIIKCEGWWTDALYDIVLSALGSGNNDGKIQIPIRVEGPHGPVSKDFRRYENLLLVAGGVGITPFLSILQEICSTRSNARFKFPTRLHLVFVVKTCQDISMLIPISSILLNPPENFLLKIKVFVTREKHSSVTLLDFLSKSQTQTICFGTTRSRLAVLGSENFYWLAMLLGITLAMFLISLIGLSHVFIPAEKNNGPSMKLVASGGSQKSIAKSPSWVADLVIIASYSIALTSAGLVATILQWRRRLRLPKENPPTSCKIKDRNLIESTSSHVAEHEIHYEGRPDIEEILSQIMKESRVSDAGVFVCGPESLKQSVASMCKKSLGFYLGEGRTRTKMNLSFHSLNFDL